MLKNIDPPLGFGNKCPNRLAYKKLIRMNMPVDQDGKVQFTTTLFGLIRENLSIKMRCGKYKSIINYCQCICYIAANCQWVFVFSSVYSRRDGSGRRGVKRDH